MRKTDSQIARQVEGLVVFIRGTNPLSPVRNQAWEALRVLRWIQGRESAKAPMRVVLDLRDKDPRQLKVDEHPEQTKRPPGLLTGKTTEIRRVERPRRASAFKFTKYDSLGRVIRMS